VVAGTFVVSKHPIDMNLLPRHHSYITPSQPRRYSSLRILQSGLAAIHTQFPARVFKDPSKQHNATQAWAWVAGCLLAIGWLAWFFRHTY
jgi:hypothetical protein